MGREKSTKTGERKPTDRNHIISKSDKPCLIRLSANHYILYACIHRCTKLYILEYNIIRRPLGVIRPCGSLMFSFGETCVRETSRTQGPQPTRTYPHLSRLVTPSKSSMKFYNFCSKSLPIFSISPSDSVR